MKKSTLRIAFTPGRLPDGHSTGYGFGWVISPDGKTLRHRGAWRAFRTLIHRDTAAKSALIFMDNSTTMYRSRITADILNCLQGKNGKI